VLDLDIGAAELGGVAAFDDAAQLHRHRLLAVADGELGLKPALITASARL
jgi:hypothetical protein